ncbi:MAG: carbohydrate kinase family protein [Vulcanococcus sp.]
MEPVLPPQVLCLGEALVDRLGPPGGDPARDTPCDDRLGGAPANVACGLARLGTPVAFLGRLGRDAIGEAFAALFAARGVDTSGLQWDQCRPSRIVLVRRDSTGERSFEGFAGAAGFADQALDAEALAAALGPLLAAARWLLVGTIPLASSAAASALQLACREAAAAGVPLALDVNWRPTFWEPEADPASGPGPAAIAAMRPLLEQAALIKCAREEAQWLFGSADAAVVSAALPQRPAVVVSDGGSRLSWCFGASSGVLPAFAVPLVDSTGAGDAFTAGLLHRFCAAPGLLVAAGGGAPADVQAVVEALRFAAACGALVCQGAGAIDPQPDRAQVEAFLAARA